LRPNGRIAESRFVTFLTIEHRIQIATRQSLLASNVIRLSTTVVTKSDQSKQANDDDGAGEHLGNPVVCAMEDQSTPIENSDSAV